MRRFEIFELEELRKKLPFYDEDLPTTEAVLFIILTVRRLLHLPILFDVLHSESRPQSIKNNENVRQVSGRHCRIRCDMVQNQLNLNVN